MVLSGETDADALVTIGGNYFNSSFSEGQANALKLEVRYSNPDGSMGHWIDLTAQGHNPTFTDNTYSLSVTFSLVVFFTTIFILNPPSFIYLGSIFQEPCV